MKFPRRAGIKQEGDRSQAQPLLWVRASGAREGWSRELSAAAVVERARGLENRLQAPSGTAKLPVVFGAVCASPVCYLALASQDACEDCSP